jgi:hypothetical protein
MLPSFDKLRMRTVLFVRYKSILILSPELVEGSKDDRTDV